VTPSTRPYALSVGVSVGKLPTAKKAKRLAEGARRGLAVFKRIAADPRHPDSRVVRGYLRAVGR
jgi:hypothetical protein